jgi:hypothetical protein
VVEEVVEVLAEGAPEAVTVEVDAVERDGTVGSPSPSPS